MLQGTSYVEPDLSSFDPRSPTDILNMLKRVQGPPSNRFADVFSDCVCTAYENNPRIFKDIDQSNRTAATILKTFGESESPFVANMFGCIADEAKGGHATVHSGDLDYVVKPELLTMFAYSGSGLNAHHVMASVQVFDYAKRPDKIEADSRSVGEMLRHRPDLKAGSADVIRRTLGSFQKENLSVRALLDTLKVAGNAHEYHSMGVRPDASL